MPAASTNPRDAGISIAIDRGGTFCDVYATFAHREPVILKVLSVDPAYKDAPTEAIRRVLELGYDRTIPRGEMLDLVGVKVIRMGTTVATNALLERKGERTAFITTKGHRDVLVIGNQSRPKLFDLSVTKPDMLYERVIEVDERVVLADDFQIPGIPVRSAAGSDKVQVIKSLDLDSVRGSLKELYNEGFRSLAIAFLHSYAFPDHELAVADIATDMGFEHVSTSSQLSPMTRIVPRAHSAVADAYLTPELKRYLTGFEKSFTNCRPGMIQFMQSDGGLTAAETFSGLRAILSGPAGGVIGYANTCFDSESGRPVIGFDMGGTSTDVSRYDGQLEHILESTTAGVTIQSPQLDISTVAAGGGSILFWENGLLRVGPESAGAYPGPACYRKGGPLTVTDANLFLGRLLPRYFPHIFGPNEDEPLDTEVVRLHFEELAGRINRETGSTKTPEDIAIGFLAVATEAMCTPIRALSEARGHDTSAHDLAAFGGAGGQVACDVAAALGISRVIIHKSSAILSAFGIANAELVEEAQVAFSGTTEDVEVISKTLKTLQKSASLKLQTQGFSGDDVKTTSFLNMRYAGADATCMTAEPENGDWASAFKAQHHKEFGFSLSNRAVQVDDIRVRAVGIQSDGSDPKGLTETIKLARARRVSAAPLEHESIYFASSGWVKVGVHKLSDLAPGSVIPGPAMIIDKTQTILANPRSEVIITPDHVVIDISQAEDLSTDNDGIDPVRLSVFGHRFMDIAEQMGRVLQKTAISVNIKERLDFSCALFDPEGRLVANAPHVPAMLGSMRFAVAWQAKYWKGRLVPGDVLLSNHPIAGGVHLPDFTVVTPVFDDNGKDIIFYTASRGHHADVGGIAPGSMPPNSRTIQDEGAAIISFKVISAGQYDEAGLIKLLVDEPAKHSFGTRTLADNISDVHAQIAATNKGVALVQKMVAKYSLEVVQMYMQAIQDTSALAVRQLLKRFAQKYDNVLTATERMDDGTPITLTVTIDPDSGNAVFDFTGTGPEVYGNWNAPPAICNSAVIYCLRCLLDSDVPLNQGCLEPVEIVIPDGSLLKPSIDAAVCGGNVLTSQRIVDVILKAFGACAASNGCMANLTFGYDEGDKSLGFYETIAGGSGAGPTWIGRSGTQTHMTNTRLTDPEIMERRYPVILRQFSLRPNSGGRGQHRGGDGVIRELEFRRPVICSILSERRVYAPYGMAGGEDAQLGLNLAIFPDDKGGERIVNMGGKNSVPMKSGDRVRIMTPGGGGFGPSSASQAVESRREASFIGNGSWAERKALQHSN